VEVHARDLNRLLKRLDDTAEQPVQSRSLTPRNTLSRQSVKKLPQRGGVRVKVRFVCALFVVLAVLAVFPPGAAAGGRRVPPGFYGVNYNDEVSFAPGPVQLRHWRLMARSGVETARVTFEWRQPSPSSPPDFSQTDIYVEDAARTGMRLLPLVVSAPPWARVTPGLSRSPPKDAGQYAAYLAALVERYGARGTFWAERPELPYRPIRAWQIWNEPHLRFEWDAPRSTAVGWPHGYVALLRAAYRAVKLRDPGSLVVAAAMANDGWNHERALYRAGARRYFDVAAATITTRSASLVLRWAKLLRSLMRRNRDARKPIWVTELIWPAARGRLPVRGRWTTNDRGMARRLTATYRLLRLNRRRGARVRVDRVYFYNWASSYRGDGVLPVFSYAGLLEYDGTSARAVRKPAFYAYVRSARRNEGCIKGSDGRCARGARR
jgi:hypothetical protein